MEGVIFYGELPRKYLSLGSRTLWASLAKVLYDVRSGHITLGIEISSWAPLIQQFDLLFLHWLNIANLAD